MDEIELRFEALQRHLLARCASVPSIVALLHADATLLSMRTDDARTARRRLINRNDDGDAVNAA